MVGERRRAGCWLLAGPAEVIHVAVGKLGMSGKGKLCIGWSVDRTRCSCCMFSKLKVWEPLY
ncbi:uncharacterized protein QC761_0018440 [Podospora bellae-mahoneyi]|uniref:Uncharacterized protein n=1 Tax=Podospora bellae-mahoneyi TaxID=2093777 RepID=A0ABR0G093_9PEZI|nr:hypothetical protein QC761_0018440 [Podospora bellae-mahoneyi]